MADLKYQPVPHDHQAFLEKAGKRKGFKKTYDDLEEKYALAREMLAARARIKSWEQQRAQYPGLKRQGSTPLP